MVNYMKKVVSGAGIVFFFSVLTSFFGYLIRMILARGLTPTDYGLFYAVFAFINFLWLFKHFGLNNALTKYVAEFIVKKEYSKVKSSIVSAFLIQIFCAGVISLLLILLSKSLSISYFKSISAQTVLIVLILYFFVSVITDVLVPVFWGFQKYHYYSSYFFLLNAFVFVFIFFFTKKFGVLSPALGYFISSIIISAIYVILFVKVFPFFAHKFKWSIKLIKKLAFFGFSLMLAMIGGKVIGYIDTLLLTYFRTLDEVGIYNVVLPTALLLTTLGSSIAIVLLPIASELWAKKMKKELTFGINLVNKYAFVFIVPVGLIFLSFPEIVLRLLFGNYYIKGTLAMQILVVGALLYSVAGINTNILTGIGKPKEVTKIFLIAAVLNIIGNLVLIPSFGINGSAFATLLSYLAILVMSSLSLSMFIKIQIPWKSWLKTFFCGTIFVILIYFLKGVLKLNVWVEMFVVISFSLMIYVLLLFLFRLIDLKELDNLKKSIIK